MARENCDLARCAFVCPIASRLGLVALGLGLWLVACGESFSDEEIESERGALSAEQETSDDPSPLPIILRWQGQMQGRVPQAELRFAIQNTLEEALEVELHATTRVGEHTGTSKTHNVRVNPKSTVAHSIGVDELGLQVVGDSAATLIAATYRTSDGRARSVTMPAVWVEHEVGFAAAWLRSAQAEGQANAMLGLEKVRLRRPKFVGVRDAVLGRVVGVDPAGDASWHSSQLVANLAELPTPAEAREAMGTIELLAEDESLSDADLAPADDSGSDEAFDKSGNYVVCFQLPYWYVDSDLGEDRLIAQTSTAEGYEPARYMLAVLVDAADQWIWAGNLDKFGCTPAISHANGSYTGWLTTSLYRPASNVVIDVFPDSTETLFWAAKGYNISGAGGTVTLTHTGVWALPDAAVVAANTLYRATHAYPNGSYTKVYASVNTSGASTQGNVVTLGNDNGGFPRAGYKVVVSHELGHAVQGALYGTPTRDYSQGSTTPSCRCDHVTSSNNAHCLQSRHPIWTAQLEGWGQFFAATTLNNGAGSNCTFAYYKEFRNDNGTVALPPIAMDCYFAPRWTEGRCVASNQGSEYDWMNFYWRVANKDGLTFSNFASLYGAACNGTCQGQNVSWSDSQAGVDAVFGSSSAKALAWEHQGDFYGVNH